MNSQMTMVVARYNENLDWLKDLSWNYIVYNKGEDNLPEWIKNEIKLPNIGREAHTYLTYIINNYDNLPDYTIFVQGNPFPHSKKVIKKINDFDGVKDFFPITDKFFRTRRLTKESPIYTELIVIELTRKLFVNDISDLRFAHGAQFIVSKKAILFHKKITYQKIIDFMIEGIKSREWTPFAKCKKVTDEDCECNSPFSAWNMELIWTTLFDIKHKTFYD